MIGRNLETENGLLRPKENFGLPLYGVDPVTVNVPILITSTPFSIHSSDLSNLCFFVYVWFFILHLLFYTFG